MPRQDNTIFYVFYENQIISECSIKKQKTLGFSYSVMKYSHYYIYLIIK